MKGKTGSQCSVIQGNVSSARASSSNARSAQPKSSPAPGHVTLTLMKYKHALWPGLVLTLFSFVTGSKSNLTGQFSAYVDLAYIPSGASSPTVNVDFFRCVRSSCYIISGDSPEREELLRQTLDALLESKASWPETVQVN